MRSRRKSGRRDAGYVGPDQPERLQACCAGDGDSGAPVMLPDKRTEWAYQKWQGKFASRRFAPDAEPGHLAWRTVVLHRRRMPAGGSVLDAGCGGGEDLVYCAERGYSV